MRSFDDRFLLGQRHRHLLRRPYFTRVLFFGCARERLGFWLTVVSQSLKVKAVKRSRDGMSGAARENRRKAVFAF